MSNLVIAKKTKRGTARVATVLRNYKAIHGHDVFNPRPPEIENEVNGIEVIEIIDE